MFGDVFVRFCNTDFEYMVTIQSHYGPHRLRSMSGRFRRRRLCRDLASCELQAGPGMGTVGNKLRE